MASVQKTLHVLTGPTAVGKTEISLAWAEENAAEIISCDSLLFYRGMDIGTAKPGAAEQARVTHHLIDVCPVTTRMDVSRYLVLARAAAEDIHARGKRILVTGGSGFYLKSFLAPVIDDVAVPAALREELASQLAREGLAPLVAELKRLNPAGMGNLDTQNPRRVLRALERCRASGETLAALAAKFAAQPGPFSDWGVQLVQLDRGKEDLERRIYRRVEEMVRSGLVAETERLLAAGLRENPSAAGAIGYRETIDLLEGRLDEPQLVATIAANTRALVKKQKTWFRTQLPAHRILPADTTLPRDLFS
jgi:tRNA dimethylallyltransferase